MLHEFNITLILKTTWVKWNLKYVFCSTEMGVMPEIAQAVEELDWL